MAVCEDCNQEMRRGVGCTDPVFGNWDRIPYPEEAAGNCHDCHTPPGELHHAGCDMEICPICYGQVISCDCDDWSVTR